MRQYRFNVFGDERLRFFGPDGGLIGERPVASAEIDRLIADVERDYRISNPDLAALGRRLYGFLDAPSQRWLAQARVGVPGLAIHIDVEERLRHLPWELLCKDGLFLCASAADLLTPTPRVARSVRDQPEYHECVLSSRRRLVRGPFS